VLQPNLQHNCDIYVHSPLLDKEAPGRSGNGGTIDPTAIYLLQDAIHTLYHNTTDSMLPHVAITADSEQDFWRLRNATIQKFRNTKSNTTNRLLYFPWATRNYQYPTTMDNIVRQWHSLEAVWNLTESEAKERSVKYTRVAMLRSDVFMRRPLISTKTRMTLCCLALRCILSMIA